MNILAIDPANLCGWAENRTPSSGTYDFGFHPEEIVGARVARMVEWLTRISINETGEWGWDAVYYEAPFSRGMAATQSATALSNAIEYYCYKNMIPVYSVPGGVIKKHATGDFKASKNEMITAALDAFPNIKIVDDNHADALWLLDYALNHQASYGE